MKLIKKNSSELKIGEAFSKSERGERIYSVISQGPKHFGYDNIYDVLFIHPHFDAWVMGPPRTTVGEFDVGESFMGSHNASDRFLTKYVVTASGRRHSLVESELGYELMMHHSKKVKECE